MFAITNNGGISSWRRRRRRWRKRMLRLQLGLNLHRCTVVAMAKWINLISWRKRMLRLQLGLNLHRCTVVAMAKWINLIRQIDHKQQNCHDHKRPNPNIGWLCHQWNKSNYINRILSFAWLLEYRCWVFSVLPLWSTLFLPHVGSTWFNPFLMSICVWCFVFCYFFSMMIWPSMYPSRTLAGCFY